MKILLIVAVFALAACEAAPAARAQEEGEARASPSRGLLKRGLVKGKPTTTTTPPPQEEVEYEDDPDYAGEEHQEPSTEAPASSTEGKKLVAGGVRPFRSNVDLLETLKRRRAQAQEGKPSKHGHSAAAQPQDSQATEAPSYNKKRFNNPPPPPARDASNEEPAPAPAPAKPVRGRFGRPATRAIQPDAEEQYDAPAPTRTGRGFSRRGGN